MKTIIGGGNGYRLTTDDVCYLAAIADDISEVVVYYSNIGVEIHDLRSANG